MNKKERIEVCTVCNRKIHSSNLNESDDDNKPKICAECNFYRKKTVIACLNLAAILFIVCSIILLLPLSKKVHFILSIILLSISIPSFIALMILKIKSRHERIDF